MLTQPISHKLDRGTAILLSSLSLSVKSIRLVWRASHSGGDVLEDMVGGVVVADRAAANGAVQKRPRLCSAEIYVGLAMLMHEGVTRG